jgi:hypothetical protein
MGKRKSAEGLGVLLTDGWSVKKWERKKQDGFVLLFMIWGA